MSFIPASPLRFHRPLGSTPASSRSLRRPRSPGKILLVPSRAVLTPEDHKQNDVQSHGYDISLHFTVEDTGKFPSREISGD